MKALLGLSYHTGIPLAWDRLRGVRAKILMYHGIPGTKQFPGIMNFYGYNIAVQDFEKQLLYLKRHCNVTSLRDLLAGRGVSRTKTNVVLTFDDGYENNYTNAYKLLVHHAMPATFALPTAFVLNREPLWNDVIEYGVNHCRKPKVRLPGQGFDREFEIKGRRGRLDLYNYLMRECVRGDQKCRNRFIDLALGAMDVSARAEDFLKHEHYRPLTVQQVHEMARSELVEFASHSVHHYLLVKLRGEDKRAELRESKKEIEQLTNQPCETLCLPGGSYDSEVLSEAFATGYDCVLTSDLGAADHRQRVLNRNGVFQYHTLHWFADLVHGPVLEGFAATRRAHSSVRTLFQATVKNQGSFS